MVSKRPNRCWNKNFKKANHYRINGICPRETGKERWGENFQAVRTRCAKGQGKEAARDISRTHVESGVR